MKVLLEGWFTIPHSYAIVNTFQTIALSKMDNLEVYIHKTPFLNPNINHVKNLFPAEYENTISNMKQWSGEPVDVVFRIVYPHNIDPHPDHKVPVVVFYTAEFGKLPLNSLQLTSKTDIEKYIAETSNLYFVTPSKWSSTAMKQYNVSEDRNWVIPHGVDTKIFYKDRSIRLDGRRSLNLKDSDIVFLSISAMSENKNLLYILYSLCQISKTNKHVKLILKGIGGIYKCKKNFEDLIQLLFKLFHREDVMNFVNNHLIFMEHVLSFQELNRLYNLSDIYFAPYRVEGFCIPVLEALSVGLPVIVPSQGATNDFINHMHMSIGDDLYKHVYLLPTKVVDIPSGQANDFDLQEVTSLVQKHVNKFKHVNKKVIEQIRQHIETHFSWESISKQFCEKLKTVITV
jgi:glycosyltransferase involved in cell wall biosynthesis